MITTFFCIYTKVELFLLKEAMYATICYGQKDILISCCGGELGGETD